MTVAIAVAVITAQAGIQTIDKAHTQRDNTPNTASAITRRFDDNLDSRLRGNDELMNFVYWCTRFKCCLQLCKAQ